MPWTVKKVCQWSSLGLFVALLGATAFPLPDWLPADVFLRLDPLVLLESALAGRSLLYALWPAAALLLASLLLGRFFCGYVCPLGTCVDLGDNLLRRGRGRAPDRPALQRVKYLLLAVMAGAALAGVSLIFLAAAVPLAVRLFGLVLHPLLNLLGENAVAPLRSPALDMGWDWLAFARFPEKRYQTILFLILFFSLLFGLSRLSPRFWCRHLCPSGALFGLFSLKPLARRRVSDECIRCGKCRQRCPMGAIPEDVSQTRFEECIVCQTCTRVCPVDAIGFRFTEFPAEADAPKVPDAPDAPDAVEDDGRELPATPGPGPVVATGRRDFLLAGAAGLGLSAAAMLSLNSPLRLEAQGAVMDSKLLRPPGSLPEDDFLARCVRCGQCMRVCPTNGLQPVWLLAGWPGLFSPTLVPRRGPCEPLCNACGQVCPTGAISALPLAEKQQAKLGTARILKHRCLAWEEQRRCLVCDEVCPYDAVVLRAEAGNPVSVPYVLERRCAGCGLCEHHCPVRGEKAIVVEAAGALRLSHMDYAETAKSQGLELSLSGHGESGGSSYGATQPAGEQAGQSGGLPPGFSESEGSLPPGFSDGQGHGQSYGQGGLAPGSQDGQDGGAALPPGFSNPAKE